jgi:hypothetical protein
MELLVPGMVFMQIDDVLHREALRQGRRPTLQLLVGQQQRVSTLVYGILNQAHDTLGRVGLCANDFQVERLRQHAHAFTFALMAPHGNGVNTRCASNFNTPYFLC